jgi:hypothetical protein
MKKRMSIVIAAVVVTFAILMFLINYFNSYSYLTINIADNVKTYVYRLEHSEEEPKFNSDSPLFEITSNAKYKLKKGPYVISSIADETYVQETKQIDLQGPASITITPSFTGKKLEALLNTNLLKIHTAIYKAYPSLKNYYRIGNEKLYSRGEWYGAVIESLNPQTYDNRRVIVGNANGSWSVTTMPPPILISAPLYPQIPFNIITDVNNHL